MSELVLYEIQETTAVVTLNRADKRNALSRGLIAAIRSAIEKARDDRQVRTVIVTGAGPTFCAGMDLAELQESVHAGTDEEVIWKDALALAEVYDLIYSLPKPTIAAVNGAAVAGGAGLVSVCDLALAVSEARFGYPEVRRGLVAAMVMPHLLRHVGERAARWLLLTGELVDAAEAQRMGFINQVVPRESLLTKALEWSRYLAEGGPQALATTKDLLVRFSRQALSIAEAAQASAAPRLGQECREGLTAFFNKQPAPWVPPLNPAK
jgi:methylglutaconyl-CoA hydratase